MHYCVLLLLVPLLLVSEPTMLLSRPDIHGATVVFEYGGDLWSVTRPGQIARRLTSHDGYESFAEFSPDGKWIAFSGDYGADNYDVYVMPYDGGIPQRLTFYPTHDLVVGWTPDGTSILFVSMRDDWRTRRLYKISPQGGLPEPIPLPSVYEADVSPDGRRIVYNQRPAVLAWRGYRGGAAPDIWLYDEVRDTTFAIVAWEGTETFPQWCMDNIYFLSDRNGRMNLYRYDPSTAKTEQITTYTAFDIESLNKGERELIYSYGGTLWVFDCVTQTVENLSITVPDDRRLLHPRYENVSRLIDSYALSPTGKRAVCAARGDIFSLPREKGTAVNLTKTPGIREKYPKWSPDGKWIAYLSDKTGEYELYYKDAQRAGSEIQITNDAECYRWEPTWSPDSKKLLWSDSRNRFWYVNIEDRKPILIDTSSMNRFVSSSWSGDSRWIAYAKLNDNWFGSLYLYSLADREIRGITDGRFDDGDVCFDPAGDFLFFISARTFNPVFDFSFEFDIYPKTQNICLLTLQEETPSPFLPESDEETVPHDGAPNDTLHDVSIDFENIDQRIVTVPVPPGNYYNLLSAHRKVFYLEQNTFDIVDKRYNLHAYDLNDKKDNILIKNIDGYTLSHDGNSILYKSGDIYGIIDTRSQGSDIILKTPLLEMKVDQQAELPEMFADAWRLQRDFFYDPDMHGLDWDAVRKKYEQFLPSIADRADLTRIIGWMFSELGASHTYVSGDRDDEMKVSVGLLGAILEPDKESGYYRFKEILKGESWKQETRSPLTEPGSVVHEGDYLIAIEHDIVRYPCDPCAYLENTVGKQIRISVNSIPDSAGAHELKIMPIPFDTERSLRYHAWVEENRRHVNEATGGRVGYIHIPNTSSSGLEEFGEYFFSQAGKEGLIIDIRYNTGGWTPVMFMNFLQRRPLNLSVGRTGKPEVEPFVKFSKNLVCIINEYAGSGGDKFAYYFRELGLGPLIGTRTWGGLISISIQDWTLMDGGHLSTPHLRFKDISGVWQVENEGVAPDIPVDDDPNLVRRGFDPQLEKAIEVIKEKLSVRK